jgi:hypothetical protein
MNRTVLPSTREARGVRASASGAILACVVLSVAACSSSTTSPTTAATAAALDPDTAPAASVDRFQDSFAHLFKRSAPAFDPTHVAAAIPAPNAPIDLDKFVVHSLGPAGEKITYYSLDILPPKPAKAYVFVNADGSAVAGQLPVIDALPGDAAYNDFAEVVKATVQSGYVANSLTSFDDVDRAVAAGTLTVASTKTIANWAVVPKGTTAQLKFAGKTITGRRAWEKHQVASLLSFEEGLVPMDDGTVPTADIVVIFKNGMSPADGFATEPGTEQTHNAVNLLPGQAGYSSYWDHDAGKLSGFATVTDFPTAKANVDMAIPVIVNCPVVTM